MQGIVYGCMSAWVYVCMCASLTLTLTLTNTNSGSNPNPNPNPDLDPNPNPDLDPNRPRSSPEIALLSMEADKIWVRVDQRPECGNRLHWMDSRDFITFSFGFASKTKHCVPVPVEVRGR